jgi:GDP-4-dehydro-6-deoxy-D-mannose reductase
MILGFSEIKNIKVVQDPSRMRPSDVPNLEGNCDKFKKKTGWKPEIPLERTIEDLLNYWRERV